MSQEKSSGCSHFSLFVCLQMGMLYQNFYKDISAVELLEKHSRSNLNPAPHLEPLKR